MSRQAHLPPRCPFLKKSIPPRACYDVAPPFSPSGSFPQHQKSYSQSSIFEEQPDWLNDLLDNQVKRGNFHRRSSSDSVAVLDDISISSTQNDEENSPGSETCDGLESGSLYGPNSPRGMRGLNFFENTGVADLPGSCAGMDSLASHVEEEEAPVGSESSVAAESDSFYGPNSPRRMKTSKFLETAIVSALSESVPEYCLPYMEGNFGQSGTIQAAAKGDVYGSAGEPNADNASKRHPGPRSRVRKLQYIAELERRVNFLQALESELTVKIEDVLQRRVSLFVENSQIKQKMTRLQEEKCVREDENLVLMKEAERLRLKLARSQRIKAGTYSRSSPASGLRRLDDSWQMLDMSRLNLN